MKRLIYKIWTFFMVGLLVSCADDDSMWKDAGSGAIKLRFTDGLFLSRVADDTEAERAISHLDVFIFDENGANPIYERINNPTVSGDDNQGTVTLKAQLSQFAERPSNNVYVVANARDDLSDVSSLTVLQQKVQIDERIHVTGTTATGAPQYFLMDGQASATENGGPGVITINAQANEDVTMYVTLKRAAAKVVVTLSQGTGNYKFLQDATRNYEMGYYFRNMPYKTTLLSGLNYPYPSGTYWRMPDKANDSAFEWCKDNQNKVVVTAYVYSHSWDDTDNNNYHSKGTSLVVNIPLWEDSDGDNVVDVDETVYANSYYQLPIVVGVIQNDKNSWSIERNTLYAVSATIEAPGAEDNKQPHTLENLKYHTQAWQDKTVNVGNESIPKYLEVNKNLLEMHNVDTDNTLEFVSSSPIVSVTFSNVYYINKYGNSISINSDGMSASFDNKALTGTITVNSDVPTNFTARYFTLTVTNEDGETKTVNVIQYPVICVSNQLSWYSYRDDFTDASGKVMTFADRYTSGRVNVSAVVNNGKWTGRLYYGTGNSGGFFASKVRGNFDDDNDGNYPIYTYTGNLAYARNFQDGGNARMYRIDVKATSSEYVVGKPRLTNEVTDPSWDNQRMVSPSFMIASRLAVISSDGGNLDELDDGEKSALNYCGIKFDKETSSVIVGDVTYNNSSNHSFKQDDDAYVRDNDELLKVYTDHCKKYVEVLTDGTKFDDWRLPTAAEIQFIIDTQGTGTNSEAIDYLLNGLFYYSACGPVYNNKPNSDGKTIRCVRDVY